MKFGLITQKKDKFVVLSQSDFQMPNLRIKCCLSEIFKERELLNCDGNMCKGKGIQYGSIQMRQKCRQ